MVAVEDGEVVAGCVAALAEDAYDMVELEVDEVGVAWVADESEEDDEEEEEEEEDEEEEEEGKEEEVDDDEVDTWPDGTE